MIELLILISNGKIDRHKNSSEVFVSSIVIPFSSRGCRRLLVSGSMFLIRTSRNMLLFSIGNNSVFTTIVFSIRVPLFHRPNLKLFFLARYYLQRIAYLNIFRFTSNNSENDYIIIFLPVPERHRLAIEYNTGISSIIRQFNYLRTIPIHVVLVFVSVFIRSTLLHLYSFDFCSKKMTTPRVPFLFF